MRSPSIPQVFYDPLSVISAPLGVSQKQSPIQLAQRLGSDKGGERAAVIYTALETARLNGIDPEPWLADVFDQLARGRSQLDLDQLMPWNWRKPASLAIAA